MPSFENENIMCEFAKMIIFLLIVSKDSKKISKANPQLFESAATNGGIGEPKERNTVVIRKLCLVCSQAWVHEE